MNIPRAGRHNRTALSALKVDMVTLENSPLVKHEPLAATDIRVQVVIDFMNSNLGKHLTLSELARLVNLSDSRFRHLFVGETGMSPRA